LFAGIERCNKEDAGKKRGETGREFYFVLVKRWCNDTNTKLAFNLDDRFKIIELNVDYIVFRVSIFHPSHAASLHRIITDREFSR